MIDSATALAFSLFENKGIYAVLVGSGISRSAQIPTGWEVISDLTRRLGELSGDKSADWNIWYKNKFGKDPSYSDLLDMLAPTPGERRAILHSYIEPTAKDREEGRKIPTKAHHAIAKLVRGGFIKVILTTNFDRLLEEALQAEGITPTIVKSDDDISGAVPLIHSGCYLVKLHGDYLDTRIRNTSEELRDYSPSLNKLLDRILDEHGLIVCGWSAEWDLALTDCIRRAANRRYPTYWASRGSLKSLATELVSARAGRIIPIETADSFFDGLEQRVSAQLLLKRQNPVSTELMVAAVKRAILQPNLKIELPDLIGLQAQQLQKQLAEQQFPFNVGSLPGEFHRRVDIYEAVSEPLVKMLAVIGQWGGEFELSIAKEILRVLINVQSGNGLTYLLSLRTYPGVLIWYAVGIGLLKAANLKSLFDWFSVKMRGYMGDDNDYRALVGKLFLWDWEGSADQMWTARPGLTGVRAAFSNHLCELSHTLFTDIYLTKESSDKVFDQFELLASIAYLTVFYSEAELKAESDAGSHVRVPFGRLAWNRQMRDALLDEITESDMKNKLLSAGFGLGRQEHLDLAIVNLRAAMLASTRSLFR